MPSPSLIALATAVLRVPAKPERILEIGPGTGYYTLDIAEWVGGDGTVEIFDLQQEFLDHVIDRAAERGFANVVPTQGDATALPFAEDSVDAVALTAVLGEIPDPVAAKAFVAAEFDITFTGGRKMKDPAEATAFNKGRYKWVKKKFERTEVVAGGSPDDSGPGGGGEGEGEGKPSGGKN